mgnify:FL=1|jgi:sodium--glutamate symport carrier gltS
MMRQSLRQDSAAMRSEQPPVAMANMSAVTIRYGASHLAFIIVPLVAAFFIDLVNALMIPFFLSTFLESE